MTDPQEIKAIQDVLESLMESFDLTDEERFKLVTHPQMRTVNIGNSNQAIILDREGIITHTILGLKEAVQNIPDFFARRDNIDIVRIAIHDVIATVEMTYTMVMPNSAAAHCSYIQLLKEGDRWLVAQMIDRGLETPKA